VSDSLIAVVTALADDELVLGHRHSEWTGFTPYIEEDVAFSSIAQDEIGHAAAYYSIVGKLIDKTPDQLALGRAQDEYMHAVLCERPNGDWAYTLARHWLYDKADSLRLESLEDTAHEDLRAVAAKIRREERYHLLHADAWMRRVSEGPMDGRTRLIDALQETFSEAMGLFEPFELEEEAIKEGWLAVPSEELRTRFSRLAEEALEAFGLPTDIPSRLAESAEFVASSSGDLIAGDESRGSETHSSGLGGRKGRHTEDFAQLWGDLTHTYREDPTATW
jgi:ring-1,2-phenylacetyl-CoA epoxidase subunit PaaC